MAWEPRSSSGSNSSHLALTTPNCLNAHLAATLYFLHDSTSSEAIHQLISFLKDLHSAGFPLHVGTLYQELVPFSSSAIVPRKKSRELLVPFLSSVTTHQKKRDVNLSHQVGVKEKEMSSAKPDYRKLRRNLGSRSPSTKAKGAKARPPQTPQECWGRSPSTVQKGAKARPPQTPQDCWGRSPSTVQKGAKARSNPGSLRSRIQPKGQQAKSTPHQRGPQELPR